MTEQLSRERDPNTGVEQYDYDSQGDRQGRQARESDGPTRYRAYAKDANGSVLGLEKADGTLPAEDQYRLDPYGELEARTGPQGQDNGSAEGELSAEAGAGKFRFQGFYYDAGIKTYDMHARHYRPDIGRFLSRDQYASAAGDQALQADTLTQNRYAFAGANPVTNVEFDGHQRGPRPSRPRPRPRPGAGRPSVHPPLNYHNPRQEYIQSMGGGPATVINSYRGTTQLGAVGVRSITVRPQAAPAVLRGRPIPRRLRLPGYYDGIGRTHDRMHLNARERGGAPTVDNLIYVPRRFNRSVYRRIENERNRQEVLAARFGSQVHFEATPLRHSNNPFAWGLRVVLYRQRGDRRVMIINRIYNTGN